VGVDSPPFPRPAGDGLMPENAQLKRIRVAVATLAECLRCERIFDNAAIPFKLITQAENYLLIDVEGKFLPVVTDLLERAGFKADIVAA
jgi:hypothetical protein